jgi:renalase
MKAIDVVVVGAGWAGLTAASRLAARGISVTVLDKARGPGGRSSTRREGKFSFDHGAQYFTARSEAFRRRVESWEAAGLVAQWRPRLRVFGRQPEGGNGTPDRRLVALPGMNGLLRRFAEGLDCRYLQRVDRIRFDGRWQVECDDGTRLGCSALLLTAPPPQAATLLGADHPLHAQLKAVQMLPCWALMLGYEKPVQADFDAAFVNQGNLAWIARNNTKPQRGSGESWVIHASAHWSVSQLESSPEQVAAAMLRDLRQLEPAFAGSPLLACAHRWRHALAEAPLHAGCLLDGETRLALAGDWCGGSRIEGAWSSGVAAARRLEALL